MHAKHAPNTNQVLGWLGPVWWSGFCFWLLFNTKTYVQTYQWHFTHQKKQLFDMIENEDTHIFMKCKNCILGVWHLPASTVVTESGFFLLVFSFFAPSIPRTEHRRVHMHLTGTHGAISRKCITYTFLLWVKLLKLYTSKNQLVWVSSCWFCFFLCFLVSLVLLYFFLRSVVWWENGTKLPWGGRD